MTDRCSTIKTAKQNQSKTYDSNKIQQQRKEKDQLFQEEERPRQDEVSLQ